MARSSVRTMGEGNLSLGELRTLSLDLLRRPPFDLERRKFTADLRRSLDPDDPGEAGDPGDPGDTGGSGAAGATGREPRGPVDLAGKAQEFLRSPEFWKQWYEEQLYYFLLVDNFAPRGEDMQSIPGELAAGRIDVREAIHRIALSASFDQRNPGADTFVTVVLEQLAGLAVERNRRELEIGKSVYDGKPGNFLGRPGASQSDVVKSAMEQRSFAESLLGREHRRLVHAAAAKSDLKDWTEAFLADPRVFPDLVRRWIGSPAYAARLGRREPMDNRLFVRALIVDLCQREPTAEEFSRMRSALDGLADPAPLRGVLARLLVDSLQTDPSPARAVPDAPSFVREQFARLLGRAPSAAEEQELVASLADPASRPALLTYALLTHSEYQSY
jgi:hypothetical protein